MAKPKSPVMAEFIPRDRDAEAVALYKLLNWEMRKNRDVNWTAYKKLLDETFLYGTAKGQAMQRKHDKDAGR